MKFTILLLVLFAYQAFAAVRNQRSAAEQNDEESAKSQRIVRELTQSDPESDASFQCISECWQKYGRVANMSMEPDEMMDNYCDSLAEVAECTSQCPDVVVSQENIHFSYYPAALFFKKLSIIRGYLCGSRLNDTKQLVSCLFENSGEIARKAECSNLLKCNDRVCGYVQFFDCMMSGNEVNEVCGDELGETSKKMWVVVKMLFDERDCRGCE